MHLYLTASLYASFVALARAPVCDAG